MVPVKANGFAVSVINTDIRAFFFIQRHLNRKSYTKATGNIGIFRGKYRIPHALLVGVTNPKQYPIVKASFHANGNLIFCKRIGDKCSGQRQAIIFWKQKIVGSTNV